MFLHYFKLPPPKIFVRLALCGVLLTPFFSCEKDDYDTPTAILPVARASSTISTVSSDEIPEIMDYVNSVTPKSGRFRIQSETNGTRSNEPDLELGNTQLKEIKVSENQYNRKNYTFLLETIQNPKPDSTSTFNLIVKETRSGTYSYIVEYRMSKSWRRSQRGSIQFSTYNGLLNYYSSSGIYAGKAKVQDGNVETISQRTACEDQTGDNGNSSGTGTSDGDGPSSTGSTGTGSTGGTGDTDGNEDSTSCSWTVLSGGDCNCLPNLIIDCSEDKSSTMEGKARNPCDSTEDLCFKPNTDPCPCNAAGDGCAEESEDPDEDENSDVAVNIQIDVTCINLKQLVQDPSVAAAITDLDGASSESNERGYSLVKDAAANNYTTNAVLGDTSNTIFPAGGDVIGTLHSHTESGQQMFSGEDILALVTTYLRNNDRFDSNNPTRPEDITMFVETSVGSFFMTINDFQSLSNSLTTVGIKTFNRRLLRAYDDATTQTDYTKAFLKLMNDIMEETNQNVNPLRLFRLNTDNETVVEIILNDEGESEDNPC